MKRDILLLRILRDARSCLLFLLLLLLLLLPLLLDMCFDAMLALS